MVPPICLFAAANLAYVILASATESIGWLRVGWTIQAAWIAALVPSTLLARQLDVDVRTYLYVYAFTQIAIHILQVAVLSSRGLLRMRRLVADELLAGSMALLTFMACFGAGQLVDGSPLFIRAAIAGAVILGLGVIVLAALPRVAAGRALARRGLLPKTLQPRGA